MTQSTTKKINNLWKKFCNWDPNYSDYFRNTAWSVSSSVLVTLALKLETWNTAELLLLSAGFICFFVSALLFTKIGNFIKKQQSKFNDLKLITRSKNNFNDIKGDNGPAAIHIDDLENDVLKKRKDYPNFLEFGQYLGNISLDDKVKERKFPAILFTGSLLFFIGIAFVAIATIFAKNSVKHQAIAPSKENIIEPSPEIIKPFQKDSITVYPDTSANNIKDTFSEMGSSLKMKVKKH